MCGKFVHCDKVVRKRFDRCHLCIVGHMYKKVCRLTKD